MLTDNNIPLQRRGRTSPVVTRIVHNTIPSTWGVNYAPSYRVTPPLHRYLFWGENEARWKRDASQTSFSSADLPLSILLPSFLLSERRGRNVKFSVYDLVKDPSPRTRFEGCWWKLRGSVFKIERCWESIGEWYVFFHIDEIYKRIRVLAMSLLLIYDLA